MICDPPKGYPNPDVFWSIKKNTSVVKVIRNPRIIWDSEGSLWFSNIIDSDDCIYECFVTSKILNRFITVSQVHLKVSPVSSNKRGHSLALQYVSSDKVSRCGGKVEFFCIYSGFPQPIVRWTKNGLSIQFDNRTMLTNFGKTLVIQDTNFNDKGSYICEVSNGLEGKHSWTINLDVECSPVFKKEPMTVVVLAKSVVTFECEANGYPEPTIEWIFNGKLIEIAKAN